MGRIHPVSLLVFLVGIAIGIAGAILAIVFGTAKTSCPACSNQCTAELFNLQVGLKDSVLAWSPALADPKSPEFLNQSQAISKLLEQTIVPVQASTAFAISSQLSQSSSPAASSNMVITVTNFNQAFDGTVVATAFGAQVGPPSNALPQDVTNGVQNQLTSSNVTTGQVVVSDDPTGLCDPACTTTTLTTSTQSTTTSTTTTTVPTTTTTVPTTTTTVPTTTTTVPTTTTTVPTTTTTVPTTTTTTTVPTTTTTVPTTTTTTTVPTTTTTTTVPTTTTTVPTTTTTTTVPTTTTTTTVPTTTTTVPTTTTTTTVPTTTTTVPTTTTTTTVPTTTTTTTVPTTTTTVPTTTTTVPTTTTTVPTTTTTVPTTTTTTTVPTTTTTTTVPTTTTTVPTTTTTVTTTTTTVPTTTTTVPTTTTTVPTTTTTTTVPTTTTTVPTTTTSTMSPTPCYTTCEGDISVAYEQMTSSDPQYLHRLSIVLNSLFNFASNPYTIDGKTTNVMLVPYPQPETYIPKPSWDLVQNVTLVGLIAKNYSLTPTGTDPQIAEGLTYIGDLQRARRRAVIIIGDQSTDIDKATPMVARMKDDGYMVFTIATTDAFKPLASSAADSFTFNNFSIAAPAIASAFCTCSPNPPTTPLTTTIPTTTTTVPTTTTTVPTTTTTVPTTTTTVPTTTTTVPLTTEQTFTSTDGTTTYPCTFPTTSALYTTSMSMDSTTGLSTSTMVMSSTAPVCPHSGCTYNGDIAVIYEQTGDKQKMDNIKDYVTAFVSSSYFNIGVDTRVTVIPYPFDVSYYPPPDWNAKNFNTLKATVDLYNVQYDPSDTDPDMSSAMNYLINNLTAPIMTPRIATIMGFSAADVDKSLDARDSLIKQNYKIYTLSLEDTSDLSPLISPNGLNFKITNSNDVLKAAQQIALSSIPSVCCPTESNDFALKFDRQSSSSNTMDRSVKNFEHCKSICDLIR